MEKTSPTANRRLLLKALGAGGGAVVAHRTLPTDWTRPVVESVLLPAHAQTTQQCSAPFTETIAGTATQTWTVPDNVCGPITIVAYGAAGAAGGTAALGTPGSGGAGGSVEVTLAIAGGTVLSIENGSQGGGASGGTGGQGAGNGGAGGGYTLVSYGANELYAGGGGGGGGAALDSAAAGTGGDGGAGGAFEAGSSVSGGTPSGGLTAGAGGGGGLIPNAGDNGLSGSGGGGGGGELGLAGGGGAGGDGSATGTFAAAGPAFTQGGNTGSVDGFVEITYSVT